MHVLIVDDHPIIHRTLGAVATAAISGAEVHVEMTLSDGMSLARRLKDKLELVLLDLGLPGYTGIEPLIRFRKAFPKLRIAVISATEDSGTVQTAMEAGAVGYIPKTSSPGLMVAALKLIASGGLYVPPQLIRHSPIPKKIASAAALGITDRQTDVLRLLVKGLGNREIARELGIAENTVKQHIYAVFRVIGVDSRTEAMVAVARMGLKLD
jgi:DNA-binding NarL/FixJ family response regulator